MDGGAYGIGFLVREVIMMGYVFRVGTPHQHKPARGI